MSCGVGCRRGSDPMLLWLWCRLAATAPIRPLAWEPPYAEGVALKRQKTKQNKTKQNKTKKKNPKRKQLYSNKIKLKIKFRSSHHGTAETKPTNNHKVVGSIPGLAQQAKNPVLL